MPLNQHPHKEVGDGVSADDWNDLVDENFDTLAAMQLAGANLSTHAAGTQIGCLGFLAGAKITSDFASYRLAIPNHPNVQHLQITVSGLRSDHSAFLDYCEVVFNDNTDTDDYGFEYTLADGVSSNLTTHAFGKGYVEVLTSANSNSAGCYGAFEMTVYNYRNTYPSKSFVWSAISPSRTAGAGAMYEQTGGGGYFDTTVISSITLTPEFGGLYLCEAAASPTCVITVLGIAGKDTF